MGILKKLALWVILHNQTVSLKVPPPPSAILAKIEGGVSLAKFFIKDFLDKKFSGASRRIRRGGVPLRGGGTFSETV